MRQRLMMLNTLRSGLRQTLTERGLLEVVTPVTVLSPGGEPHLEAVAVELHPFGKGSRTAHLRTSPEVWHKKLISRGSGAIFEIAPCLRDGEGGPWHDLEFEMVEWYRPGARLDDLMDDLQALLDKLFDLGGQRTAPQIQRYKVAELFHRFVGIELDPSSTTIEFHQQLAATGLHCADDDTWDDAFFRAWISRVEPELAKLGAVVVERYPASQAAMARLCHDDQRFCARFELYVDGLELANAFDELTDGQEQRRRFDSWQQTRRQLGHEPYRADNSFFVAVDRLPATVGIALGLDRLIGLCMGAKNLAEVRPFLLCDLLEP
jgi:lysyl-tRNA synthetase class 2